jgi:DNA polymerase
LLLAVMHPRFEPSVAVPRPTHPAPPRAGSALAALSEATNRCRECPIGAHATQSVVGLGPLPARLMLVGEQPGDQEDLQGLPFVGPAGQLLARAMARLNWPREAVFVTNAVKHFKYELRGKRRIHKTPAQREAAACLHWLEEEIALARPEAIVAMGATAARSLLGRGVAVTSERGHWLERERDGRKVLVTLHPSALLRVLPTEREAAFERWLEDLAQAARYATAGRAARAAAASGRT